MVRLSPIATAVFRLTEAPSTVESIAAVLEESFGVPEAVPTLDATRLLIADLALAGLVHRHERAERDLRSGEPRVPRAEQRGQRGRRGLSLDEELYLTIVPTAGPCS
jgi:glutathione S-transferase